MTLTVLGNPRGPFMHTRSQRGSSRFLPQLLHCEKNVRRPMTRKIASVAILLFALLTVKTPELGQERKPPLTKDEILRLLKAEGRGRLGQTNVVMEVAERGIAFPVDEPTLEELRRAGARSLLLDEIRRSGKNPGAREPDATSEESGQGRVQDLEQ